MNSLIVSNSAVSSFVVWISSVVCASLASFECSSRVSVRIVG